MRYILPGMETRMSLPAFKREIEEAVAAMPRAPSFSPQSAASAEDEADFDQALKAFRRAIMIWRSDMLAYVPKLDGALSKMGEGSSPEVVKIALNALMHQIDGVMEAGLAHAEKQVEIPPEVRSKLALAGGLSPQARKAAKSIEKKWRRAATDYRDILIDLRDRLKAVEWDHDPDARHGTGEVISTPAGLNAYLARLQE